MRDAVDAGLTSIIIVAADSGPLLGACVASVLAEDTSLEVVVVDNASSDGEIERLAVAHAADARLRILRNDANIGFGPACNRGAAKARGDALLILNPDCAWHAGTLAAMREILAGDPRIGLLGIAVANPDGSPARGNRRRDPTLRRALMTLGGLARLESRWPALAGVEMPPARSDSAIEFVEAVSGACMMLPRAAFEHVGGFDEGYFLHVEDIDLCRRVRDAGSRVAYASRLHVTHAQGTSSRSRPVFVARAKHRGMWRYFTKFDPAARNVVLRAIVWCGVWTHFAVQSARLALRGRAS